MSLQRETAATWPPSQGLRGQGDGSEGEYRLRRWRTAVDLSCHPEDHALRPPGDNDAIKSLGGISRGGHRADPRIQEPVSSILLRGLSRHFQTRLTHCSAVYNQGCFFTPLSQGDCTVLECLWFPPWLESHGSSEVNRELGRHLRGSIRAEQAVFIGWVSSGRLGSPLG